MKKLLFLLFLLVSGLASAQPSTLKPLIITKFPSSPLPNERIGSSQLRDVSNAIADQIIFGRSAPCRP